MAIRQITARSILDSRGVPTVEATVVTDKAIGVAAVPSGTSTGKHEATELRDGDRRWEGQGVSKAISHVNVEIAGALKGKDVMNQASIDQAMIALDGTPDKSRLGANAILAVSQAALQAAAAIKGQPLWRYLGKLDRKVDPNLLPIPFCNLINGGQHADNQLVIQEFMVVPHGLPTFSEALRAVTEVYYALGKLLAGRNLATSVGAEGGYAPVLDGHLAALDLLMEAIKQAGFEPGQDISLALDVAASSFYENGSYIFEGQPLTVEQLTALYAELLQQYPILSFEDPLAEDDWDGWGVLFKRLGTQAQVVGDDLTVTNTERINRALSDRAINAALLKPNQVGTHTETKAAWKALTDNGLAATTSHRSGETNDTIIADLTVGWGVTQIKAGAPSRGERVAKYNRLLAIEQQLGGSAVYAGQEFTKQRRSHATT